MGLPTTENLVDAVEKTGTPIYNRLSKRLQKAITECREQLWSGGQIRFDLTPGESWFEEILVADLRSRGYQAQYHCKKEFLNAVGKKQVQSFIVVSVPERRERTRSRAFPARRTVRANTI